jgi:hypothetical protein
MGKCYCSIHRVYFDEINDLMGCPACDNEKRGPSTKQVNDIIREHVDILESQQDYSIAKLKDRIDKLENPEKKKYNDLLAIVIIYITGLVALINILLFNSGFLDGIDEWILAISIADIFVATVVIGQLIFVLIIVPLTIGFFICFLIYSIISSPEYCSPEY